MDYSLERTIIEQVRKNTLNGLRKRIPENRHYDYRLVGFCIVQTLIDVYKEAGVAQTLELTVDECGITKPTYYNWFEKYRALYENLTQNIRK